MNLPLEFTDALDRFAQYREDRLASPIFAVNPADLSHVERRSFSDDELAKRYEREAIRRAFAEYPVKGSREVASIFADIRKDRPEGPLQHPEQARVLPVQSKCCGPQAPLGLNLSVEVALHPALQACPSCNSLSVEVVATATVTEGGDGASRAAGGCRND